MLMRPQSYVFAGHPDFIAIERCAARFRHAKFVVLDIPSSGRLPTHFVGNKEYAIVPEKGYPVKAIVDVFADNSCANFFLAQQFEAVLCIGSWPPSQAAQHENRRPTAQRSECD